MPPPPPRALSHTPAHRTPGMGKPGGGEDRGVLVNTLDTAFVQLPYCAPKSTPVAGNALYFFTFFWHLSYKALRVK